MRRGRHAVAVWKASSTRDDRVTAGRQTFGKSTLHNQVVHFRMAELKTEVELQRSLVYRAVEEYIAGADVTKLASMAKLNAGACCARSPTRACSTGAAWATRARTSRRAYRDTRLTSIGGGADEIMLGIICKLMGILPGQRENHFDPENFFFFLYII